MLDVRAGGHARYRAAKSREGNPVRAQIIPSAPDLPLRQDSRRRPSRFYGVQAPAIVNRSLAKHGDGKRPIEPLQEEVLNLPAFDNTQPPAPL